MSLTYEDDRDMEAWDRAEAAVANYDPADHARGVDDPLFEDEPCDFCGERNGDHGDEMRWRCECGE